MDINSPAATTFFLVSVVLAFVAALVDAAMNVAGRPIGPMVIPVITALVTYGAFSFIVIEYWFGNEAATNAVSMPARALVNIIAGPAPTVLAVLAAAFVTRSVATLLPKLEARAPSMSELSGKRAVVMSDVTSLAGPVTARVLGPQGNGILVFIEPLGVRQFSTGQTVQLVKYVGSCKFTAVPVT